MRVYYNEFDPFAAAWLRELMRDGLIPEGDVDERSIVDVAAGDLRGYDQCHFFAGIGGWPYALDLAGWPRDEPIWTGSCPCQPFSVAGSGKGEADERHLWPAFQRLIAECRPPVVAGEQVASAAGRLWLAGVRADLEELGYAVGAADLCAAGVGAPHIRQRLYWVADTESQGRPGVESERTGGQFVGPWTGGEGATRGVVDTIGERGRRGEARWSDAGNALPPGADDRGLFQSGLAGLERRPYSDPRSQGRVREVGSVASPGSSGLGEWADSDFIATRDGKIRRAPTEPALFPLAHGFPGRVGLLRGAGNAIVHLLAAEFIQAYREAR